MKCDWQSIELEYTTGTHDKEKGLVWLSYRELAIKHDLSFNTLSDYAKKHGWLNKRKDHKNKVNTKALQIIEKGRAEKVAKLEDDLFDVVRGVTTGLLENKNHGNKLITLEIIARVAKSISTVLNDTFKIKESEGFDPEAKKRIDAFINCSAMKGENDER